MLNVVAPCNTVLTDLYGGYLLRRQEPENEIKQPRRVGGVRDGHDGGKKILLMSML